MRPRHAETQVDRRTACGIQHTGPVTSPGKQSAPPRELGVWTAGAVSQRIGVPVSTLRSWNHRYGVGPIQDPGTHRLYSDADVAQLETIVRLVEAGTPPRVAVELARRDAAAPVAPAQGAAVPRSPAALARAAWDLNTIELTAAFLTALRERGTQHTWQRLCRPALARLTPQAAADTAACIGAELVLTDAMTTALHHALSATILPPAWRPAAVLACADGELHGLPLLALQASLTESGTPSLTLGPSVPDDVLLGAIERTTPRTVVVYAHRRETARPALLRALTGLVPTVLAAGPGWTDRKLPTDVIPVDDLPTARRLVTDRSAP